VLNHIDVEPAQANAHEAPGGVAPGVPLAVRRDGQVGTTLPSDEDGAWMPHATPLRDLLAQAPAEDAVPGRTELVRGLAGRRLERLIVLDDDPTGTQCVADVPVITRWSREDLAWGLEQSESALFILTNSRATNARRAASFAGEIVRRTLDVAHGMGIQPVFVSRSDSTLRGHFPTETDAMGRELARRGHPVDALLLCPAFPEAGRITVGNVHWLCRSGQAVPVSETEYAGDETFGYRESNLKAWVEERTAGRVRAGDVRSLGLEEIRSGGPARVAEILSDCAPGSVVVLNAASRGDLDVLALGAISAEIQGKRFLYRSGPSFVAARGGYSAPEPLRSYDPSGARSRSRGGRHGLVVVGSHTQLTHRQLDFVLERSEMTHVELDVSKVLDPGAIEGHVAEVLHAARAALSIGVTVLSTSRVSVRQGGAAEALSASQRISDALTRVVARLVDEVPVGYIVAKGGITSSDVLTRALKVRRARVVGKLSEEGVSLWSPTLGGPLGGVPVVVFPGNVGRRESLMDAIQAVSPDDQAHLS
jgi:uncharacterized protein YgbK (DUF1537 family)